MAGNWTNCCNYNFTFHCNVLSIYFFFFSVVYTWYSISVIALSFYYYYFSSILYCIILSLFVIWNVGFGISGLRPAIFRSTSYIFYSSCGFRGRSRFLSGANWCERLPPLEKL